MNLVFVAYRLLPVAFTGGMAERSNAAVLPARGGSAFGGKTQAHQIMSCVYVLYSFSIGKFYIGSSRENSAITRINSHNSGKTRSAKYGRPWTLIYEENCPTYTEARQRENFLKSGQGRKWIKEEWQSGRMRRS